VLVVDDSEDLREMWRAWLTHCGFRVDAAADGAAAIRSATGNLPVLVLMDLWMPGTNGMDAARRLRADPRTGSVPIIALTSDDQWLEATAPDSPFERLIVKPVGPDQLMGHIRDVLRGKASGC
jgi:CheY-like chemotaxis protein